MRDFRTKRVNLLLGLFLIFGPYVAQGAFRTVATNGSMDLQYDSATGKARACPQGASLGSCGTVGTFGSAEEAISAASSTSQAGGFAPYQPVQRPASTPPRRPQNRRQPPREPTSDTDASSQAAVQPPPPSTPPATTSTEQPATGPTGSSGQQSAATPPTPPTPSSFTPDESNRIGASEHSVYHWDESTGTVYRCQGTGSDCRRAYYRQFSSLGEAQQHMKRYEQEPDLKFTAAEEVGKDGQQRTANSDSDAPNMELSEADRSAEARAEADRNSGRAGGGGSAGLRTGQNYERIRSQNGTNSVSRRLGLTDSATTERMAQSLQMMSQTTTQAGGMAVGTAGQFSQARLMEGDPDYTVNDATIDNLRMSARTNGAQAGVEGIAVLTAASRLGAHQFDVATLKNVQEKAENRENFLDDRNRVRGRLDGAKNNANQKIVSGDELRGATDEYRLNANADDRTGRLTKKIVDSYDMDRAGRYELTERVGSCDPGNQACIDQRNQQIERRKNQFNARVDQTEDDIAEVSEVAKSEQGVGRGIAAVQMLTSTVKMASHLSNAILQKKMADKMAKRQEEEAPPCNSENPADCLWGAPGYDPGGDDTGVRGGDTIGPGSSGDVVENPAIASPDGALDPDGWGTGQDFTPDRPEGAGPGVAVFTPGGTPRGGAGAGGGVGAAGATQAAGNTADTGEAKTAFARGDSQAAYAGGRMRRGGARGGGGGSEPSIDLKSILGQLLPNFGEETKKESKDLLDYGAAGAAAMGENGSLLDREVNIFYRIGEAYQRNVQEGRVGRN